MQALHASALARLGLAPPSIFRAFGAAFARAEPAPRDNFTHEHEVLNHNCTLVAHAYAETKTGKMCWTSKFQDFPNFFLIFPNFFMIFQNFSLIFQTFSKQISDFPNFFKKTKTFSWFFKKSKTIQDFSRFFQTFSRFSKKNPDFSTKFLENQAEPTRHTAAEPLREASAAAERDPCPAEPGESAPGRPEALHGQPDVTCTLPSAASRRICMNL